MKGILNVILNLNILRTFITKAINFLMRFVTDLIIFFMSIPLSVMHLVTLVLLPFSTLRSGGPRKGRPLARKYYNTKQTICQVYRKKVKQCP